MLDDETQSIIVEGNDGYQKTKSYVKSMLPKHVKKVKKYRDKVPLFLKKILNQNFMTFLKLRLNYYLEDT